MSEILRSAQNDRVRGASNLATEAVALQFGSRVMTVSETIAAISTPPGEGAIAMVRVSGANAIEIADQIFRGKEKPSRFASHVQHLGEIFSVENRLIDQAVLSIHRTPASYTGEDLVEISCHGGTLVTAKVLEACLHAGARAARPGEFTERAFLNGKMDLTQAEAVIDLIGYDRVIVSDTHGTTRDTIEETVNLDGVPIRLLDTAGLRPSESELESKGIARTEKSLQLADLRLHIADCNAPRPPHFNSQKL